MKENQSHKFDNTATAAMLGALFLMTVAPIFIKYLTGYFDSWSQNFYRYIFAMLFWLPLLITSIRKKTFNNKIWLKAILPSVFLIMAQTTGVASLYYINPGFGGFISKSSVIWIMLLSIILFPDERGLIKNKLFQMGFVLCVAGLIGVTLTKEDFRMRATFLGIVLVLLFSFIWAFYTTSIRLCLNKIDSRAAFSVISIYALAGLGLAAFLFGKPLSNLPTTILPWATVVISGIDNLFMLF